ncbi:MAG: Nif3-like dinuclear metal center hexameric protein [Gemmatimonadota bacterium]|nr:MAG: Nif3-like dinuclear metal center hexameric protein [Gemmatimonadota bacterium]
MQLRELTAYLDGYLRISEVADDASALNGLQVDNSGTVERVAVAVDACQATIEAAVQLGAHLLLVHHGLFWGGLQPITGRHASRIRRLVEADVAVYSAHLPLDAHPEVGNNAELARMLGVTDPVPFGEYHEQVIGVAGSLAVPREELVRRLRDALGGDPHVIATGPDTVQRVGIVTGGGGSMIAQARDAGLDTYVTGEGAHHTYFDAEEWRLNVIYAGHYLTETVGVKALGRHLEQRFGLPWDFIDHPTGL